MIHKLMLVFAASLLLGGCSASKDKILPAGSYTMLELWNGADEDNGGIHAGQFARDTLRRALSGSESETQLRADHSYSRSQQNEITQQFRRLPDPDMVMYLYPHLAGGNTPVPGYSTVFPFYDQVHYAMPGERVEAL